MKQLTVKPIIALSLLLAVPVAQAQCAPSLIGSPCAFGGIASASQIEPDITLAAGNPVHLVTGNKYQQDTDLPANPHAPGLELIRHYNAMDTRPSALGPGWVLSYDTRLHRSKTGWQVVQADGGRISFSDTSMDAAGVHHGRHGRLDHVNHHHNWFWPSGIILRFSQHGHLVAIRWPNGESVYIDRHGDGSPLNGAISRVHNDRGQALAFHYDAAASDARLTAVDTPQGRFSYHHDSTLRLVGVTRPDGMQRHYLHEAALQGGHAHALTGIELSSPATGERQRTHTWAYDDQGRAIRSVSGDPDSTHNALDLEYRQTPSGQHPGLTVVSNEHQQKTYFQTAIRGGRHVLLSVQGAGCFGCAAPGTQADYDDQGRLMQVNGTRITRTPEGAIHTLEPAHSGWPGLALHYSPRGLRERWDSDVTGTEQVRYNEHGLPVERRFANGDTVTMDYDIQHRPTAVHERHADKQSSTRLHWHGHQLIRIEHPAETETRRYDAQGRVVERTILRDADRNPRPHSNTADKPPTGAPAALPARQHDPLSPEHQVHILEQFSYDTMHRMTRHDLPEGGSLHYSWGQGPQITAIHWQDASGQKHNVIETRPGQAGYWHGNGLHLDTRADGDHRVRQLRLHDQESLIWGQELGYDSRQRITAETIYAGDHTPVPGISTWHYAHDEHSRLIAYHQVTASESNSSLTAHKHATTDDTPTTTMGDTDAVWLAWHEDGTAAAQRTSSGTARPAMRRDASGLVQHANGHDLLYDAGRRLHKVLRDGQLLARYRNNAFGYRVSRENARGQRSDFFYLNNQLVAQTGPQAEPGGTPGAGGTSGPLITRRYIYAHHVPVAVIDYSPDKPAGRLLAVHADLQGAPRLMTDSQRKVRWHADYTPLGLATIRGGDMHLDLRLPGQIADPDTGWHDNLLRTYLPEWGHYLEPDPLGPVPGNQAYGYARQQPRRHADPMGLLLFAFDGTRHSATTQSNVWKMSQYYLDGPVHYHPGPGNSMFIDWDAITGHQASTIIETQWKWLLNELSRPRPATETIPIDILGFSRGAALARHFANLISQHVSQGLFRFSDPVFGAVSACVDLRFMGLFDTVAQFGIAGSQNQNYDLSIAAAWEWVAHAIALHERRWAFPLTAAGSDYAHNVVEAPFIGAHGDIGGGILPADRGKPGGRGDLSNVALNWMIWQARAASVPMGDISSDHSTTTLPIVHDHRGTGVRSIQDGDRRIDTASGASWLNYQDDHPRFGRTMRDQTEGLIQRYHNWQTQAGAEVGIVDMDSYAQWLHDELGWHALPV